MIDQLFGSKTRAKLLKLFFSNPNRAFYVREITRKVEEQINSVRRELANLLSLGLITSDSTKHKLYYEVNQTYEHYDALRSMFSEVKIEKESSKIELDKKTFKDKTGKKRNLSKAEGTNPKDKQDDGIALPEAQHWQRAGNIDGIAYSGVFTRDYSTGVDVLVIGDAIQSKIESVIADLEKEKNKELKYAIISSEEWLYRKQVHDKFWLQFLSSKKQIVLDKANIFVNK